MKYQSIGIDDIQLRVDYFLHKLIQSNTETKDKYGKLLDMAFRQEVVYMKANPMYITVFNFRMIQLENILAKRPANESVWFNA